MNTPIADPSTFQLAGARLYQPDDELAIRLPNGTAALSGYIQTLAWVCSEYIRLLNQDLGSFGVLIGIGIRPGRNVRLWCEQVGDGLSPDHWAKLVELLDGAGENVWPDVTAPVALAGRGCHRSWPTRLPGDSPPVDRGGRAS